MDNWNVLAAQTSSSVIGRDDSNLLPKEKLVNKKHKSLLLHSPHYHSSEDECIL